MMRQQFKSPRSMMERRKHILLLIIAVLVLVVVSSIWILVIESVIPNSWSTILVAIFTILSVILAFLQFTFSFSSSKEANLSSSAPPTVTQQSIMISSNETAYRNVIGVPPSTDARVVQSRENIVKEVYQRLIQQDVTAIVLTGLGGIGKSTLAALVYRYAEEQRHSGNGSLVRETLWLSIDDDTSITDLARTILDIPGKRILDFDSLRPRDQAMALFTALNMTDEARLIILDQFEKLLDSETGHVREDRPGIGEWLDLVNNQPCSCKFLFTSRLWPWGTIESPPNYLQEYHVTGLAIAEGIDLLRQQGVVAQQATEADLRSAVERYAGHALSLMILASYLKNNRSLTLQDFLNSPIYAQLWKGDSTYNTLNHIYTQQLNVKQRALLRAFSVYREPVPLESAKVLVDNNNNLSDEEILSAINTLLTQSLLEASGKAHYQLHPLIASYVQDHFVENDADANERALQEAHSKAAGYYLQVAKMMYPPREQRRQASDMHPLIEAIWQLLQANQAEKAYDLARQEDILKYLL